MDKGTIERARRVLHEAGHILLLTHERPDGDALGAATATETIERALDLVVFQRELIDGTRAMQGVEITSPDAKQ